MPIDHARIARHPVVRWSMVGGVFALLTLALIELFSGVLHWPYWLATALQAEITTILRFLVNDRWVFGHKRPTWRRCWQYHVANAGGFAVWYIATNLLQRGGVHYLVAPVLGAMCSAGVSLLSNFLWVWRKKPAVTPVE
ncbi:MAG: GtrA family protein [Verrucomicrobiota bacterium]